MWICLNNSFLSIVEPGPEVTHHAEDVLVVRARHKGDIEAVFPVADVVINQARDYPYRAFVHRETVAHVLAMQVHNINYTNFKDSVTQPKRVRAYTNVWVTLLDQLQDIPSKFKRVIDERDLNT
jgi:hypothetical protein